MSEIKVSVHDSLLEQNRLHLDEMARRLELEVDIASLRKSYNVLFSIYEQDQMKFAIIYRHLFPETPIDANPYIPWEWDRMIKRIDELVGQSLQSNSNGKLS